jgi:protein-tyrosine phosphatase
MFNDVVLENNQQDPPEKHRFGVSKLTDWLFLGGEEDVCQILDKVDVWIDFRNFGRWNRKIFLPNHVVLIRMPFKDGDLEKAEVILPICKDIVLKAKNDGKKILVSCHAGASRFALLVLMVLADVMGVEDAMLKIMAERTIIEFHDNFIPLVEKIFKKG